MKSFLAPAFWQGKRVFLTGHSGFKGSWLTLWLHRLGAELYGYSLLEDDTQKERSRAFNPLLEQRIADIGLLEDMTESMAAFRPDVVIHLAAQPLVRLSYADPVGTFATNVMGTAHVLEAIRQCNSVRCALLVTTDKVYEDQHWPWAYRENDRLGGYDPYSASKAAAELVCASWRSSFLAEAGVTVMTARAGNVIGGWDYAQDRLIPDMVRALTAGQAVTLRNPHAVRPWQHVLEPLAGYLLLIRRAFEHTDLSGAWNFGPDSEQVKTVSWMARHFAMAWGKREEHTLPSAPWQEDSSSSQPHETDLLLLSSAKARQQLGWFPVLDADQALNLTAEWYQRVANGEDALAVCEEQIQAYTEMLLHHETPENSADLHGTKL